MMGYLVEFIKNLCSECQSDRMSCVLSPKCRRRYLIKTRILTGSPIEELPRFCYNQVLANVQRFKDRKTALYTPVDDFIYLEDFFEAFFPKISKKLYTAMKEGKLNDVQNIINKTKIPAIYLKKYTNKSGIIRNVLKLDKMIATGSFIYDFCKNLFVIWKDKNFWIADFQKGYAICNAHKSEIKPTELLRMIIPLYAQGKNFILSLETSEDNITNISILISKKKVKNLEKEIWIKKFDEKTVDTTKIHCARFNFNLKDYVEISVKVGDNSAFDDLNSLFNKVGSLTESENINLLNEIKER